jgi:hypothetical protein
MGNLQNMLSIVFGLAVTFFVPGVVWITLVAGLYQLLRDGIRHVRMAPRGSRRLAQKPAH